MDKTKIWPGSIDGSRQQPNEVVCIYVEKIYDACSQRECEEFFFDGLELPNTLVGDIEVDCSIEPGSEYYSNGTIEPINGGPLARVKATVCANLVIVLRDTANSGNTASHTEEVCFQKEVILYAPDPVHMGVLVESIFEALACSVVIGPPTGPSFNISATVGAFIIVKTSAQVQLLVPAFGFCPVPPECEEFGDLCEQFMERPFPPFFPPQLGDLEEGE